MKFPDVPKVEIRCPSSGDCGDCFDEVRTFTCRVNGHHDGVVSARFREFRDEVHADGVRGMEGPGTKLITRMPIFDRTSTLIYYTRGLCKG